jgi:hypothetical protein
MAGLAGEKEPAFLEGLRETDRAILLSHALLVGR